MWHSHDGMGWWMVFGGSLWILLLILIVFAILALANPRSRSTGTEHRNQGDAAVEIARQRYARGDIDREEFTQLMGDIQEVESG